MKKFNAIIFFFGLAVLTWVGVREVVHVVRAGVACSVPNTFSNGTTADATQVNANFAALVACFANSAAAGANSDITSLTGLTTPLTAAAGGSTVYVGGTSVGTNTVTLAAPVPTGFTLTAGNLLTFIAGGTNTGNTTLNVNSLGARAVVRQHTVGNTLLAGGEWLVGGPVLVYYDGTQFVTLTNYSPGIPGTVFDYAGASGCPLGSTEAIGGVTSGVLATILGTTWGTAGTLPDLRGRAVFGRDSGGSARITVAGGNFDGTTVGNTGGVQSKATGIDQTNLKSFALAGSASFALNSPNIVQLQSGSFGGTSTVAPAAGVVFPNAGAAGSFGIVTPNTTVTGSSFTSGGGGTAFSTLDPAGIVVKCVKL